MTDQTPATPPVPDMTRLQKLRDKLRARQGKAGYEKNCETLAAEIARLEGKAGD